MNEKPSKYEVVEMYDVDKSDGNSNPSAPLMRIADLTNTIEISIQKEDSKRGYGPFDFFIKDTRLDLAVLQGQVGFKRSVAINHRDGSPHISITPIENPVPNSNDEDDASTQFAITRGNTAIGTVGIGKYPDYKIYFSFDGQKPYLITSIHNKETEILISRSESDQEKLVTVNIPKRKGYEPFEASIAFSEKTSQDLTEDEKELILSIVITYMVSRTGPVLTKREHDVWATLGVLFAISLIVGVVVGFVYLLKHLSANCNAPGMKCGKTRY